MNAPYYPIDFFSYAPDFNFKEVELLEQKGIDFLFENLLLLFSEYNTSSEEEHQLKRAFSLGKEVHKNQKRESGALFFTHPLIVALLSLPYKPCVNFVTAVLLHDTIEDYDAGPQEEIISLIKKEFGEEVYDLIEGVSKVSHVKNELLSKKENKQLINEKTIEKIFLHSRKDFRILLIKIIDRLHNIITIAGKKDPEKRRKKVEEAVTVYVASAKRLGVWGLKNLLENACYRALNPQIFSEEFITYAYSSKKKYELFSQKIKAFPCEPRTILEYNSFSSDKKYHISIIVQTEEDCYRLFSHLNKICDLKKFSFVDYISKPKLNGYKALHASYIVDSSYSLNIHIVSEEMDAYNTYGVFVLSKKHIYTLPIFSEESLDILQEEMKSVLHTIKTKVLRPQISVHNEEKGMVYIPKGATVLDAAVRFFPKKFQKISKVFLNGKGVGLYSGIKENDILDFSFSEKIQLTRNWIDFVAFKKDNISDVLSQEHLFMKSKKGRDILQKVCDEQKLGYAESVFSGEVIQKIDSSLKNFHSLCIAVYEGRIRGYECLAILQGQNGKKNNREDKVQKLQFSSPLSSLSNIDFSIQKQASQRNITVESISFEKKQNEVSGKIFVKGARSTVASFVQSLKPEIVCTYTLEKRFLLKSLFYFLFPTLFSFVFFHFLLSQQFSPALYYGGVFGMLAVNALGYWFFHKYFSYVRENMKILWGVIVVNIVVSALFIYFFFLERYDIYNLNFYFPLLLLIFSMALPSFFFSKKDDTSSEVVKISSVEYKKKQKEKIIGYFLRLGAVIIWGLDPVMIKYSPLSEIPIEARVPLLLFGAALFSFFTILFLGKNKIKTLYKIPINKYFILSILAAISMSYFLVISLEKISSTNFILLNVFGPVFALLLALTFWKSQHAYLQSQKNIIKIFFTFLMGSVGASFVFYKDLALATDITLIGLFFAFIYMLIDVLFITSQVKYVKYIKESQSYFMNFYLHGISFLLTLPFLIYYFPISISLNQTFWVLLSGIFWGAGTLLSYEAFRRIDGFIGFLMFNFSILVTISVESFMLGEIKITPYLLIGAVLIIGASILAEMINTKCEKENILEKS